MLGGSDCIGWCWVGISAVACDCTPCGCAGCIIIDCGTAVSDCISGDADEYGWFDCGFC